MARTLIVAGKLLALACATTFGVSPLRAADPKTGPSIQAPVSVPTAPAKDLPTTSRPAQFPAVLPDPKAPPASTQWSPAEVQAAKAQCEIVLAGHDYVAIPSEPMRDGECGAAAPFELISIGKSPQVTLSQPAMVTCDMIAALSRWMKESVQPAARRHLGGAVVRIQIMSSYSCRNAYGRKKSRLSEHGRANALDVRGFLTERSVGIDVDAGWGMTARDVRAQVAAAEAAKLRAAQAREAAKAKGPKDDGPAVRPETAGNPDLRGPVADGKPGIDLPQLPGFGTPREPGSFGLAPPAKLGGPKAPGGPVPQAALDALPAHQAFLRQIHAEACKYFGTVLGPESNEAHRNHFHIDMAPRSNGNFCE